MDSLRLSRRTFLKGSAGMALLGVAGCDDLSRRPDVLSILNGAETLTERAQRLIMPAKALAREFNEADISPIFRANGTTSPDNGDYQRMAATGFADWRLRVDGLVDLPAEFSLPELRAMPSRTQITRHDCVEGWSCIGKWKGVPLALLLERTRLSESARYVVFHCADSLEQTLDGSGQYYESISILDASHPQTILAYEMNDKILPIAHGAPLRLRLERQLGYKMAKYIMRIEILESYKDLGRGRGGYWEDRGYEWYAGI